MWFLLIGLWSLSLYFVVPQPPPLVLPPRPVVPLILGLWSLSFYLWSLSLHLCGFLLLQGLWRTSMVTMRRGQDKLRTTKKTTNGARKLSNLSRPDKRCYKPQVIVFIPMQLLAPHHHFVDSMGLSGHACAHTRN